MTDDLIWRLLNKWRAWGAPTIRDECINETCMAMDCKEAADEISRLQAKVEQLRSDNSERLTEIIICPACLLPYRDPARPGVHSCSDAQRDEISRLQADVERHMAIATEHVSECCRLQVEVERLTGELTKWKAGGKRGQIAEWRDKAVEADILRSENLALHEQVAALESREVCTVAHEDVETCGYCQRDRLRAALSDLLEHYLRLANSGDAGFWDPEKEVEIISAREALSSASPPDDAGEGVCAHLYRTSDPNKGACIYCGAVNGEGEGA